MTFGSLFAGIGGFDLGFERAGHTCLWQVEKDEWCRSKLAKHWPNVKRYGDIHDVGKHNLSTVDIICGGFPCQDVSVAGNRAGIKDGTRSGLWAEYNRIICELRPRYVVVENVPGLRSNGMGRVLGDLAASGYDARWYMLSAKDVGAPHLRKRVFIVADTKSKQRNGSEDNARIKPQEQPFPELGDSSRAKRNEFDQWQVEPDVGRVAHGVPFRVDRLKALGNAVVPQCAEYIGRLLV